MVIGLGVAGVSAGSRDDCDEGAHGVAGVRVRVGLRWQGMKGSQGGIHGWLGVYGTIGEEVKVYGWGSGVVCKSGLRGSSLVDLVYVYSVFTDLVNVDL